MDYFYAAAKSMVHGRQLLDVDQTEGPDPRVKEQNFQSFVDMLREGISLFGDTILPALFRFARQDNTLEEFHKALLSCRKETNLKEKFSLVESLLDPNQHPWYRTRDREKKRYEETRERLGQITTILNSPMVKAEDAINIQLQLAYKLEREIDITIEYVENSLLWKQELLCSRHTCGLGQDERHSHAVTDATSSSIVEFSNDDFAHDSDSDVTELHDLETERNCGRLSLNSDPEESVGCLCILITSKRTPVACLHLNSEDFLELQITKEDSGQMRCSVGSKFTCAESDRILVTVYLYERVNESLRREGPFFGDTFSTHVSLFSDKKCLNQIGISAQNEVFGMCSENLLQIWSKLNEKIGKVQLKLQQRGLSRCKIGVSTKGKAPRYYAYAGRYHFLSLRPNAQAGSAMAAMQLFAHEVEKKIQFASQISSANADSCVSEEAPPTSTMLTAAPSQRAKARGIELKSSMDNNQMARQQGKLKATRTEVKRNERLPAKKNKTSSTGPSQSARNNQRSVRRRNTDTPQSQDL